MSITVSIFRKPVTGPSWLELLGAQDYFGPVEVRNLQRMLQLSDSQRKETSRRGMEPMSPKGIWCRLILQFHTKQATHWR